MSNEKKKIDPMTGLEVAQMWYRDRYGQTFRVIKYADPYGDGNTKAEEVPIYVAGPGMMPELLGDALSELSAFRTAQANKEKAESTQLAYLSDRVDTLEEHARKMARPFWRR